MCQQDTLYAERATLWYRAELKHFKDESQSVYGTQAQSPTGDNSTLITAGPNETSSAGALAIDVVTVCAILAAADLGTVSAVETRRTTWDTSKKQLADE